ncbi:MAG: hypothetical protein K2X66_07135 [Cyanobacteria bacterium]|nr:hypothetical protein [Cyanobacteriota bacterium]
MKIELRRTGGFIGKTEEQSIDVEALPAAEKTQIQAEVAKSNFFQLPENTPPSAMSQLACDMFKYSLKVEDQGKSHRVIFDDFNLPAALQPLFNLVKKLSSAFK